VGLQLSRLRGGELLAGAGAVALLVLLFAAPWYGARTGWQALTGVRWMALLAVLAAFALAYLQASRRAPALPATMSVIATVLALLNAVWLAVDVAVSHPPQQSVWAPIGLAAACGLLAGAFLSLRQEGVGARDERTDIPTVAASGGVRS